MTAWQIIPNEELMLYSPIGLKLIDDMTGAAPVSPIAARLEERDSSGNWHETDIKIVRSLGNVLSYPGLGRSADVAATPMRRYRVHLSANAYRPDYLMTDNAIEFDVHPYDDTNPPAVFPTDPVDVILLPSASYPFPRHVRVLRGSVEDVGGTPVANAEVVQGAHERVLTDDRGEFALPLRWPPLAGLVQIDAVDHRTGRNGFINASLPGDLAHSNTITIN